MLKWFNKKKKKNNKGFTLVELVIVVAILAILVGLLAPQYTKYVEKSRQSADVDNMEEMVKAIQVALSDPDTNYTWNYDTAYTITMSTTTRASAAPITTILETYLGSGYANTKLKSSTWGDSVVATIKVKKDGTMSVTYNNEDFAKAIGGTKTTS